MNSKNQLQKQGKAPREIRYFKQYVPPPKDSQIRYSPDGKQIFFKGKEVTPKPLFHESFSTYPEGQTVKLKKMGIPPMPPASPAEDVDLTMLLNYRPPTTAGPNKEISDSSADPFNLQLRRDATLDDITADDDDKVKNVLIEKDNENVKIKIDDCEVFVKEEFANIPEDKVMIMLEETETIFLLEIYSLQTDDELMDIYLNDTENILSLTAAPSTEEEEEKIIRKSTAEHCTQTLSPMVFDAQVSTHRNEMKDVSTTTTESCIYDAFQGAAIQEAKDLDEEIKHQFKRLYDMLMDTNGHFKNDLHYINFFLKFMAIKMQSLTPERRLEVIMKFIKDYEEDPGIEELAKELSNDYAGFIKRLCIVRDEMYPPDEPEEGEPPREEFIAVERLEEKPLPGYEPEINEEEIREIKNRDEFSIFLPVTKRTPEEEYHKISQSDDFRIAATIMENVLTFQDEKQNIIKFYTVASCPESSPDSKSLYRMDLLWEFNDPEANGMALNCFAWSDVCPDIFASGYGNIGHRNELTYLDPGLLLVWSVALPKGFPICRLNLESPVVSIQFHPQSPYFIAIGLNRGDVVLAEIGDKVAEIRNTVILHARNAYGPAYAITWFGCEQDEQDQEEEQNHVHLITAGRKGHIFYWKPSAGFLISETVLCLPPIRGKVKGIQDDLLVYKEDPVSVPSQPDIICIELHPQFKKQIFHDEMDGNDGKGNEIVKRDNIADILGCNLSNLYLLGSEDGAIYRCCYYGEMHSHRDYFRAHNGPVYSICFNKFVDSIFLTCGADWTVRIWSLGVGEPLITLNHDMECVESAQWSAHYSTIIVSIRRNEVCVWDLARRSSSPVTILVNPKGHKFTSVSFSPDGANILTGDSQGNLCVYHLEEMPFISMLPDEHLVHAIRKALINKPEILRELEYTGPPFKED